jgi:hypothetical protein
MGQSIKLVATQSSWNSKIPLKRARRFAHLARHLVKNFQLAETICGEILIAFRNERETAKTASCTRARSASFGTFVCISCSAQAQKRGGFNKLSKRASTRAYEVQRANNIQYKSEAYSRKSFSCYRILMERAWKKPKTTVLVFKCQTPSSSCNKQKFKKAVNSNFCDKKWSEEHWNKKFPVDFSRKKCFW